jgi:hypothetical protein
MPDLPESWDPNEWELHARGLLHDRHGDINVMKVPARHKGDFGLDLAEACRGGACGRNQWLARIEFGGTQVKLARAEAERIRILRPKVICHLREAEGSQSDRQGRARIHLQRSHHGRDKPPGAWHTGDKGERQSAKCERVSVQIRLRHSGEAARLRTRHSQKDTVQGTLDDSILQVERRFDEAIEAVAPQMAVGLQIRQREQDARPRYLMRETAGKTIAGWSASSYAGSLLLRDSTDCECATLCQGTGKLFAQVCRLPAFRQRLRAQHRHQEKWANITRPGQHNTTHYLSVCTFARCRGLFTERFFV